MSYLGKWREIDSDPNSLQVLRSRAEKLQLLCDRRCVKRIDFLTEKSKNKKVADVGCVCHDSRFENTDQWLHKYIAEASRECVGIDVLAEDLNKLKKRGYHVSLHDLTKTFLVDKQEVIIGGEIIEHIDRIGDFLKNVHESLDDDGELFLTTPHPWFLGSILRSISNGYRFPHSADHVCWFDPSNILELCDRYGYDLKSYCGAIPKREGGGVFRCLFEKFLHLVRRNYIPMMHPHIGCRSLIYHLVKKR